MKLLYANDQRGIHAPSWYEATCKIRERAPLDRQVTRDVCIIGAGFTGLGAALSLAESGIDCVVLDAHRIAWGASGRNGGQLGSGFNQNQMTLANSLGRARADTLWKIAQSAKHSIHDLCKRHSLDVDYKPGIVLAQHRRRFVQPLHEYCQYLEREHGYVELEPLSRAQLRQHVNSDNYHGGALDHGAGHLHPLKLAAGMADAAESLGATLHEMSEVIRIETRPGSNEHVVVTPQGSVTCRIVVLAANGYLDNLAPAVNRWVMPINNFIAVTEPLGTLADSLLPHDEAVADSRFVVNYFRRVGTDRLLFGGGENYSYRFPADIGNSVRKTMAGVFPQLHDINIDYAWGGTLAITRSRLPYASRLTDSIYTAGGYSGHGLALAGLYGKAIGEHIAGNGERFDLLSQLPTKPFPGGLMSRPILLALAMSGYSWLDKL